MYELKIYREVMCHDNEEWCKNWRRIGFSFQNLMNFDASTRESQNLYFKLCLVALKIDAKFERKLTSAFKNDMGNLENFHRIHDIAISFYK